jgi:hypothetical protein
VDLTCPETFCHLRSFFVHFCCGLAFVGVRPTIGRFWEEEDAEEEVDTVEN